MTWIAHDDESAIEFVRLIFAFKEPIPRKVLKRSTAAVEGKISDLGFYSPGQGGHAVATIDLDPCGTPRENGHGPNGAVMRRHRDGVVAEEIGFHNSQYDYTLTSPPHWNELEKRLDELLLPALTALIDVAELDRITIEHRNNFLIDGESPNAASPTLGTGLDPSTLEAVLKEWGSSLAGGGVESAFRVRVNRNFDLFGQRRKSGDMVQTRETRATVEMRSTMEALDIPMVKSMVDGLRLFLLLFGIHSDSSVKRIDHSPEFDEVREILSSFNDMKGGWDGPESQPPKPGIVENALKFIDLWPTGLNIPEPELGGDGNLELVLYDNDGFSRGGIEFIGNGRAAFAVISGSGVTASGTFDADSFWETAECVLKIWDSLRIERPNPE